MTLSLSFFFSTHELADADAASSPLELGVVDSAFRFLVLDAPLEGGVFVRDALDPGIRKPSRFLFLPPVPVVDRPWFYVFVTPSLVHVRVDRQLKALLEILVFPEKQENFPIES